MAIIAIIPNEAESDAPDDDAPIANGRRNVELRWPVATPPQSNPIAETSPGVFISMSIIRA